MRLTLQTVGMVTLLLGFGMVFTRLFTREGVAQSLATAMLGVFSEPWQILLMMNLLILVLGMFIDGIPILIVVVPLILPLVAELGINMVQLGAIVVVNVGLGVVTPPYAISIFIGSRLGGVRYSELVRPMMYFRLLVGLPVLLLTTFIPALSLWLPTLVVGSNMVGRMVMDPIPMAENASLPPLTGGGGGSYLWNAAGVPGHGRNRGCLKRPQPSAQRRAS